MGLNRDMSRLEELALSINNLQTGTTGTPTEGVHVPVAGTEPSPRRRWGVHFAPSPTVLLSGPQGSGREGEPKP